MGTHTATLPGAPQPSQPPRSSRNSGSTPERDADVVLRRGESLGQYRLLFPVGSGGMAYVWAAARSGDYGFERLFAVKVMREDIANVASFRKMFLEEAKLAARVHHTNVVEVIDLGEEAGMVYQVMPLLDGDSLAGLMREWQARDAVGRVPLSVAARVMVDVLRGLHAAHEAKGDGGLPLGIVHRDVSPQNILVGTDGVSKIADFGVAKAVGSFVDETDTGAPKGKFGYMAPEQLEKAQVDRRCDVFAAGVVLWELLAATRLAPSAASTLLGGRTVADPRSKEPSVPRQLAEIAMRALERSPDDRFASADAMADALEASARECGLALSTKEVASWTTPLTTARMAKRRGDMEEAATILSAVTLEHRRAVVRQKRPVRTAAVVVALVLCAGGAAWISARAAAARHADAPTAAAATPPSSAVPWSPAVPASPPPPAAPPPPSDRAASDVAAPAPGPSVRAAPAVSPHPVSAPRAARPRETPPSRAKFANPYTP